MCSMVGEEYVMCSMVGEEYVMCSMVGEEYVMCSIRCPCPGDLLGDHAEGLTHLSLLLLSVW